jgi:hypothetical protein
MKTLQDFKTVEELTKYQANMTREERQAEVAERQRIVDGMLWWIAKDNHEPTKRERETLQHHRNVIASITLGLEDELKEG